MMRLRVLAILMPALAMLALLPALGDAAAAGQRALVLEIDGVIGPPLADYIGRELRAARPDEVGIVVLRMNTPGGLDASMRQIVSAILASPVPVATYVAPNGARAASAGTYIAYASAIAAMAPGTNIGAATPIQLAGHPMAPPDPTRQKEKAEKAGEPADAETRKLVNDAIAYIRGLAALNGRNADWAADAVRSAASVTAAEALSLHVIDVIADDIPDLLRKIDGRTVNVAGKPQQLATAGLDVVTVPPGWRTELLGLVTNPNVAFILMLIGIYGLILEFFNPGAVAPGLIGAISLLVALYALALLPISYAGAALVLLGVALMVAEAHIGAFGALGVGGIAAFVIGALLMFPERVPGFTLSGGVIAGAAIGSAALFIVVLAALLRSRKRPVVTGSEALIGAEGETVAWQGSEGRVRVKGEIWLARSDRAARGRRSREGSRSRRPRSPRRSHPSSLACVPLVRRRRDVTARYYLRHAARPYVDVNPKAPEAGQHARPGRFSARTASGARHLHGSGWRFRPRADAASECSNAERRRVLRAAMRNLPFAEPGRRAAPRAGLGRHLWAQGRQRRRLPLFAGLRRGRFRLGRGASRLLPDRPPGGHSRRRHALQTEERGRAQSHHRLSEGAEVTGRPVPSMSRRGSADAAPQSRHHDQEQRRTP